MDFKTRHLRYFIAVAEENGFSRAAQRLNVSQPALSQRIRGLEEQLGSKLFHREGRRTSLTHAGEQLLDPARALVGSAKRLTELASSMRGNEPPILRISVSAYSDHPVRAELLAALASRFPTCPIQVEMGLSQSILRGLTRREFDWAIIIGGPLSNENMESIVLRWFKTRAVVPRSSPLADHSAISLQDLSDMRLVSLARELSPRVYDHLVAQFESQGSQFVDSPDRTPTGTLAYAAGQGLPLVSAFPFGDQQVAALDMVSRPLSGMPAVAALMAVRSSEVQNVVLEKMWRFASKFTEAKLEEQRLKLPRKRPS